MIELRGMDAQGCFRPYYIMSKFHFLFHRPLGANALPNLFVVPAPRLQAPALRICGAGNANNVVKLVLGAGFEKQWYHYHRLRNILRAPLVNLFLPEVPDAGMKNTFQQSASSGITENSPRERVPPQRALRGNNVRTESGAYFRERRLAGFDNLPCDGASVSTTATPRSRSNLSDVDLPMPTPPVKP